MVAMSVSFVYPKALWLFLLIPLTIGLALLGRQRPTRVRFWGGLALRILLLSLLIFVAVFAWRTGERMSPDAISMGLQRLKLESELPADQAELVDSMLAAVGRTNHIVSGLKQFTRELHPRFETVNLVRLLDSILTLYHEKCESAGIAVRMGCADGLAKVVYTADNSPECRSRTGPAGSHDSTKSGQVAPVQTQTFGEGSGGKQAAEAAPLARYEIAGDADLLGRVLENLLKNAIEAQPDGGYIDIRISQAPGRVELIMKNPGCTMPPEKLPTVIEPYVTTKTRGSGLGLSVCRRIVEAHHGKLRLALEDGNVFVVSLELPDRQKER